MIATHIMTCRHWASSKATNGSFLLGIVLIVMSSSTFSSPVFADPVNGKWDSAFSWPIIPIHSVVTSQGTIMTFGTSEQGVQGGELVYDIWDPTKGTGVSSHATLPNTVDTDLFCAGMVNIPLTGQLITVGGDDGVPGINNGNLDTTFLDPTTNAISSGPSMDHSRWYATVTTLPNGSILTQGGSTNGVAGTGILTPEIFTPTSSGGRWSSLSGATSNTVYGDFQKRWWYPRSWVAPNGRVFGIAGSQPYWVSTEGSGNIELLPTYAGTNIGASSTAVMYGRGKVMQTGGGHFQNNAGSTLSGSKTVTLIDINGVTPIFTQQADVHFPRHWANTTLMPNGQVLLSGGTEYDQQLTGQIGYQPEIWDPATMTSKLINVGEQFARLYHSSATLLADGTIISGGGGAPGPLTNLNAQIYQPPYLFASATQQASRPAIVSAPHSIAYNSDFQITVGADVANDIQRVTLIKTGSTTHSFNMDQRIIEAPFVKQNNVLTIHSPANSNLATPGFYFLFVINTNGTPSLAKLLKLDLAATGNGQAKNLVSDSRFESVTGVAEGRWVDIPAGGYFGGWELVNGPLSIHSNTHHDLGAAGASGAHHIDLSGTSATIKQYVSGFVPGQAYQLSFKHAKHDLAAFASGTVSIAGLEEPFASSIAGNVAWESKRYTFTATQATHQLVFTGSGSACCGLLLDDVIIASEGPTSPGNQAPVVTDPGDQTSRAGTTVSLTIQASDPDGDALTYTAGGLPTGLNMNSGTGEISGTPTTVGTFNTTVTVSDGHGGQRTTAFTWTISAATPNRSDFVQDGGFEHVAAVALGGYLNISVGESFGAWTLQSGSRPDASLSIHSNAHRNLGAGGAGGAQHIDLSGDAATIVQPISGLEIGQSYSLQFTHARHDLAAFASGTVSIAGLEEPFASSIAGNVAWESKRYTFTATQATHQLVFTGSGSACCGLLLDDVIIASEGPTPPGN